MNVTEPQSSSCATIKIRSYLLYWSCQISYEIHDEPTHSRRQSENHAATRKRVGRFDLPQPAVLVDADILIGYNDSCCWIVTVCFYIIPIKNTMTTFSRCSLLLILSLCFVPAFAEDHDAAPQIAPEEALQMLMDGNARFVTGNLSHPHESLDLAKDTAVHGQHPFVTILSCSDSRVPLNVIFDQGIGDIFAIRVAGNVVGSHELGSIEYGVEHAGTRLCIVLGHTKCGAVTAASTGGGNEGNIKSLMQAIRPAVRRTETETGQTGKEIVEACAINNVLHQIETLYKESDILREAARKRELMVVGAIYDIESGKVEIVRPRPKTAVETPTRETDTGIRQQPLRRMILRPR